MDKSKERDRVYRSYHRRAMLMFAIIGIGIAAFFALLEYVLRAEVRQNQDADNNRFFSATIKNLESNAREIEDLTANFHENNGIMLGDLAKAYANESYRRFAAMPASTQSEILNNSTLSMEDCELLYITNRDGDVLVSAVSSDNGSNIISNDMLDLTKNEFEDLRDSRTDHITIQNPFYSEYPELGKNLILYCKAIPGTYSADGNKYIILGFTSDILDRASDRMRDLSAWLNGSTIGNNGVALMVDVGEDRIVYGKMDGNDLSDLTASSIGIDKEVLTDRYTGIRKINGKDCYISSKKYSSYLYGEDNYLVACIPTSDMYGSNFPVILWNLCILFIFLILIAAYSSFVRSEMLRNDDEQHRIRLFSVKGTPIYYSRTLGRKIIPVILTSVILIFLSALYVQALMKLSGAFSESVSIVEEISTDVEESIYMQDEFTDYYNMQFESRAKLLAFIVALHGDEYFDFASESEGVMTLGNTGESGSHGVVKDDYNNPVKVINNSKALDKLRDANYVKNIYLISDAGYTLATSSDFWRFSISNNEKDQSNEFWEILEGKKDVIIQNPMISDEGIYSQFIGCAFDYYTCLDEDGNTRFVRYTDFLKQNEDDKLAGAITKHRGLLQIELDPGDKDMIIESAKPEYVLSNIQISNGGFLIGFMYDTEAEIYRVFYSGVESMVDKDAGELGISDNAFSGNYNGFQRINGKRYLQSFRPAGEYYIATEMPTDRLYYSSFITGLFCASFGFVLMFILSFFTLLIHDMDEEELHREENDPLAVFGHWDPSGNWQNSTPTQKFEFLIKHALLLGGTVFIASITYEAYHFGSNSAIVYILSGGWDRGIHIFSLSAVIVLLIFTGLILKVFEHVIDLIAEAFGSRVETMMHLSTSLIKAAAIIIVGFYCFYLIGIDATRLLASAGILSVVVGLGAQSLVGDLLAGIFIVMEGSIHVGDYVMIEGIRGKIVDIGLRVTRYEDDNQNIRIICNNQLKSFANMSMKYSIIYYNIPVPYDEDHQRIKKILNEEFLRLYEENRFLKGIPVCQGIENFADSSVELRVKFMCDEKERYDVQRFMHDEIMRIFTENGINIPFQQLDVHYGPLG
ncbi:MAG TPA: hypothetical protein DIS78_05765 [Lachnospiraceae bacterium]|nr:hypothetical protein [Lachnospiraceae bacterium]